jgi:serine protease Do
MAGTLNVSSINLVRILGCCLWLASAQAIPGYGFQDVENGATKPVLVRVNIISEIRGVKETVEINGKPIADYSPTISQIYPSTGIVLDHTHVLAFLGYRWIDIQDRDPRIEIFTDDGQKWEGKLIGIDQKNRVGVIQVLSGKLRETPVCPKCEVRDGITVMAPAVDGPSLPQYKEAQILSVGTWPGIPEESGWKMAMNRAFPDIGLPIFTKDLRVLGFVASQDPMGMQTVYPISQLLSSAEKILKTKGDIRAGWLGIYAVDARPAKSYGVVINDVEPDSPAAKAGLLAGDLLVKFKGKQISDTRQFVYLVEDTSIGSKAKLDLIRQGNPMTVFATIEARRPRQNPLRLSFNLPGTFGRMAANVIPEPQSPRSRMLIGLETLLFTPSLADAMQMPGQTGLLVTDVVREMPADRAGVLVGDIITSIDDRPIVDPINFASYLMSRDWSAPLILKVLRKGVERTVTVHVPEQDK